MPISVTRRHNEKSQHGSALIIVAVMLIFVGFILTLGIGPFATESAQDRIRETARKQQFLISEMAAYAQRENRIPCPADPAVAQTNANFGFARGGPGTGDPNNVGVCDANSDEGIVPFRTLGLEPYDAIDGWGRFMTYRISPVMADPFNGTTTANANIYMRCRRFPWFDNGAKVYSKPYFNATNIYPEKAGFCCPPDNGNFGPATDMRILSSSAAAATIGTIGRTILNDDNINTITPNGYDAVPETAAQQQLFAFAIISHGSNGVGAYVANGTNARLAGAASADETVNFTFAKPLRVIDRPMMLAPGPNYFDDIVVWRTQIGLMAELNNASCYLPWR